jgi:hypothetical protein
MDNKNGQELKELKVLLRAQPKRRRVNVKGRRQQSRDLRRGRELETLVIWRCRLQLQTPGQSLDPDVHPLPVRWQMTMMGTSRASTIMCERMYI